MERWRRGQWGELVELTHTGLGNLYVQSMGSGSVVVWTSQWETELARVREALEHNFCAMPQADPGAFEMMTDVLFQDGHRLVTFWHGVAVADLDVNEHLILERFAELRGLRRQGGGVARGRTSGGARS